MPKLPLFVVPLLVAACTSSSPRGDDDHDHADGGGTATIDAPLTATPVTVNCQPHTFTDTAPDGSKTVTTEMSALVDVSPDDHYIYTYCNAGFDQDYCPTGDTCTGTRYPGSPQDQRCLSGMSGTFIGGKLLVTCGTTTQHFNASGTMTSSGTTAYDHISVVKF